MNVVGTGKSVIRTRTDYSQTYRFRLWVALVEDMAQLGMGYRAYYSHIFESFRAWQSQGIFFVNAKGGPLVFDALNADDVHGFLGKKDAAPQGPKRKIESSKFAVLDAFFQKKHPILAQGFGIETPVVELVSILKSFFSNETLVPHGMWKEVDVLKNVEGALVINPFSAGWARDHASKHGIYPGVSIPVFMISAAAQNEYSVVHKIDFPCKRAYVKAEVANKFPTEVDTRLTLNENAPTVIDSGIGLPFMFERPQFQIGLACILRERVLRRPHLVTLEFQRRLENPRYATEEGHFSARSEIGRGELSDFWICRNSADYDIISEKTAYSRFFIDEIIALKENLGSEV